LKRLNASTRNWIFTRSVMAVFFTSEVSKLTWPGA
jgi:hypothetical protein